MGQSINPASEPQDSSSTSIHNDLGKSPLASVDDVESPGNLDHLRPSTSGILFMHDRPSEFCEKSFNLSLRSLNVDTSPPPEPDSTALEILSQSQPSKISAAVSRTKQSNDGKHKSGRSRRAGRLLQEPRDPWEEEQLTDSSAISCSGSESESDRITTKGESVDSQTIIEFIKDYVAKFKEGVTNAVLSTQQLAAYIVEQGSGNSQNSSPSSNTASTSSQAPGRCPVSDGQSRAAQKRPSDNDDPDKPDDDDKMRRGKKPKNFAAPQSKIADRRFACPFHQHSPQLYQTGACTGPGWFGITRVK